MNKFRFVTTLALGALVAFAPISMAAPGDARPGAGRPGGREGRRGPDPAKRLERMGEFLKLSAAQKAKLKPIFESAKKQHDAVRANTKLTPDQKRTKGRAIREATDKKVNAVLTAAQRKKVEEMKSKMREGRGNREGRTPQGAGRPKI